MNCEHCGARMTPDHDPYGTGDHWFVLYEPQCDCELRLERKQDSIATLKQAVLENHNDYIKTLEEKTK